MLNSAARDDLYAANINPIATFPGEGVVIFGQKTLQTTPSALDRVNVRRLVNYLKKEISRASARILFEPNVPDTWNKFKNVVNPFLNEVKALYGIEDAKVVLDETTTTADLVDRNIMYCKLYVKPTRAIEYIAIDFVVTNSGAAFSD
jgi:phage tail sheath protein FI